MSFPFPQNPPNTGPPSPRPEPSTTKDAPCSQCGHLARLHRNDVSCSARRNWLRKCQCTGFTALSSGG